MARHRFVMVLAALIAGFVSSGGNASAAGLAQRCAAAKRKAVGLTVKRLATCDGKATMRGVGVDLVCVARAGTIFTRAWARAERRAGCATAGDQTAVENRIDAHDADLQARLHVGAPASRCSAGKLRDTGRAGLCRLACSAKAAKASLGLGDPVIARCTAKCVAKMAGAFAHDETRHDCHTTGDVTQVDSAIGAFVDCITSLVGVTGATPCASPSTTTTTSPATTTSTSSPVATTSTLGAATSTTVTTTSSTTTSTGAPLTQCCIPSSVGGAFICVPESAASCATDGGTNMGPGTCSPDPCPTTSTSTSTLASTSTSTLAATSTTVTTTSSTTTSTGAPLTQCCIPSSVGGAFICVPEPAVTCAIGGGTDMGPGTCSPDPCPTTSTSTTILAPTTSSSTSTTTTTTTSTSTITLLACGGLFPACLGSCPLGQTCTAGAALDPCTCIVVPTTTSSTLLPCGGIFPVCLGSCPPGQTCTGSLISPCSCQ